jgi:hypothetical protein
MTVEVPELKMSRIRKLLELFLTSNSRKKREIASMVGKLNTLEPALGKSVFVGTRPGTIAVVIATEVSNITKRPIHLWESKLKLDIKTTEALREVGERMGDWNGHPIRAWHTGIALSSILPLEATASLDRKIPAKRTHDRKAVMASNASDFAVAWYSIEGIPEFSFSTELQDSEKTESLSVRELLAISKTLDHMLLSGELKPAAWTTLWWLTDNANVEKMLAKGSGKLRITGLVMEILWKGSKLCYDIHPIWVSRDNPFLQKADCLSNGLIQTTEVSGVKTFLISKNALGLSP